MGAAFNAAPVFQEGINMKKVNIPMDHPRPALYRVEWKNLNGAWQFAFDDKDEGICEHWEQKMRTPLCKISSTGEIEQRFRLN